MFFTRANSPSRPEAGKPAAMTLLVGESRILQRQRRKVDIALVDVLRDRHFGHAPRGRRFDEQTCRGERVS